MIGITFNVDNIDTVLQAYDEIELIRYTVESADQPDTPVGEIVALTDWVAVSGTDDYPVPVELESGTTVYMAYDPEGESTDWYSSRYYNSTDLTASAWSAPILGSETDLYYDPIYPEEDNSFTDDDTSIIANIRRMIGDPIRLERISGEEALAYVHPDHKTFELPEKGWPVYITIGGVGYTSATDPTVNGYKYLRFKKPIDLTCYSCVNEENVCGDLETRLVANSINIWYYSFRMSDKQILDAYDNCFPPEGLTTDNATSQSYVLQTAINLITKEILEDATEDGAIVNDNGTSYNPTPGLSTRKDLLNSLQGRLNKLVSTLIMTSLEGVLLD